MRSDVSDIFWLEENRTVQCAPAGCRQEANAPRLSFPVLPEVLSQSVNTAGRGDVLPGWRKHCNLMNLHQQQYIQSFGIESEAVEGGEF
jgi:hypothetical protein